MTRIDRHIWQAEGIQLIVSIARAMPWPPGFFERRFMY
jgi:hypothetical protein